MTIARNSRKIAWCPSSSIVRIILLGMCGVYGIMVTREKVTMKRIRVRQLPPSENRVLRREGLTYQRTKTWKESSDPEYEAKKPHPRSLRDVPAPGASDQFRRMGTAGAATGGRCELVSEGKTGSSSSDTPYTGLPASSTSTTTCREPLGDATSAACAGQAAIIVRAIGNRFMASRIRAIVATFAAATACLQTYSSPAIP